jgi:hypothetical protein
VGLDYDRRLLGRIGLIFFKPLPSGSGFFLGNRAVLPRDAVSTYAVQRRLLSD